MAVKSPRSPLVSILLLALALLPLAYAGAYFVLGNESGMVDSATGRVRVRVFGSEQLARLFVPMAWAESHVVEPTETAWMPPPPDRWVEVQ